MIHPLHDAQIWTTAMEMTSTLPHLPSLHTAHHVHRPSRRATRRSPPLSTLPHMRTSGRRSMKPRHLSTCQTRRLSHPHQADNLISLPRPLLRPRCHRRLFRPRLWQNSLPHIGVPIIRNLLIRFFIKCLTRHTESRQLHSAKDLGMSVGAPTPVQNSPSRPRQLRQAHDLGSRTRQCLAQNSRRHRCTLKSSHRLSRA